MEDLPPKSVSPWVCPASQLVDFDIGTVMYSLAATRIRCEQHLAGLVCVHNSIKLSWRWIRNRRLLATIGMIRLGSAGG